MPIKPQINYKSLREINPETARLAVLQYLSSKQGNITETARIFGIQRLTVYNILYKQQAGDLKDQPKAPKRVANKTSTDLAKKILLVRKKTGFGSKKLQKHLLGKYHIKIAYGTLRGIVRRGLRR